MPGGRSNPLRLALEPPRRRHAAVRLDASSVARNGLPGPVPAASKIALASRVPSGVIGAGMFATFARDLFVKGKGALGYRLEESLSGRASVRYDFRVKPYPRRERPGKSGPERRDQTSTTRKPSPRTEYARTHVGDSDALAAQTI